jgi:hypothetical protein
MTSIPTAPPESFETTPHEPSLVEDPEPGPYNHSFIYYEE